MIASNGTPSDAPVAPQASLALRRGIVWSGVFRWTSQLLSWASMLVLARLLSPRDYGLVGVAAIWSTWGTAIADFGIGATITSGRSLEKIDHQRLHTIAVLLGVMVSVLLAVLAGPIALFHKEPELRSVILALSPVILLDAARVVPVAVLSRALSFRTSAVVEFTRAMVQLVVVITLASLGFGFWALVGGLLVSSLASTATAIHRTGLKLSRAAKPTPKGLLVRARTLYAGTLAWQAYRGADTMLVGRIGGASAAGEYNMARTLAWLPTERLVSILTALTQSFFAHLSDDVAETRRYVLWLTEAIVLVTLLPLVGLAVTADLAIPVLLGAKWAAVATPMRLLIIPTVLGATVTIINQIAWVRGGESWVLLANIASALLAVVCFGVVNAQLGLQVGLIAWTISSVVVFFVLARRALQAIELSMLTYLAAWRTGIAASGLMALSIFAVRQLLPGSLTALAQLAVLSGSGILVAAVLLLSVRSPVVEFIRSRVIAAVRRRFARPHALI